METKTETLSTVAPAKPTTTTVPALSSAPKQQEKKKETPKVETPKVSASAEAFEIERRRRWLLGFGHG